MTRRMLYLDFALVLGFCAGSCSKAPDQGAPPPEAAGAPAIQAGELIFQTRCFVCHGRGGNGDGPASTGLGAAVRDLTSPTWQDATSDEVLRKVIRSGATAVGGTAAMPPNPDLSDAQINSLTRYIRGLRR